MTETLFRRGLSSQHKLGLVQLRLLEGVFAQKLVEVPKRKLLLSPNTLLIALVVDAGKFGTLPKAGREFFSYFQNSLGPKSSAHSPSQTS